MTRTLRFVLALFAAAPLAAYASNLLVVKTDKGEVRGALTTDGQVRAFKGIPFAAPPVGDLRWQPPQPAADWKGVRDATKFGPHCMQFGKAPDRVFDDPGASEDCLTLNVWTPANTKQHNLPVMVWIYGGGFRGGGSSETRQDGQFLAHRNVVIVSMNYRLGIFGFFVHPELVAESPHHASGNYGLMDQDAALDWVQKNIASFGGDPQNVTIFGQSAGSLSVSALMASPLAQGKFEKAIGESGAEFGTFQTRPLEPLEQEDVTFAQRAFGTSKLADLRKIPAEELQTKTQAYNQETHSSVSFWPDVDGWFLPEPVPQIYAEGKQAHVPLLAGWNADEQRGSVIFANPQPTAESFKAKAEAEFGPGTAEFLKLYPASTDAEALRSAGDLAGDHFIAYATWDWLAAQVDTGKAPVYRYHFELGSPGDLIHPAILGAPHSDEIEYVFGSLDTRPRAVWRPQDRELSNEMGEYWTNFARTGNPNGDSLPDWPTYNAADNWQVMHLDASSEAKPDTLRTRYLFLDKEWGQPTGQEHWVASWGAGAVKAVGQEIAAPGITFRNIVHLSLGGKQVRLTLSNEFGTEPLTIGGVTVARSTGDGTQDSNFVQTVTFDGKPNFAIAAGAIAISDPVSIDARPLSDLAVNIYLPAEKTSFLTDHPISHQTNYSASGDQLRVASMPGVNKAMPWRILTAVDVMAPAADAAIVAFGDSITDGQGSTMNANHRWPNLLADRLQADPQYAGFAVVDEGIGGNRILHQGGTPDARAGEHPSGLARWNSDALDRSGVKYIILLEGVNDIGHSSLIKAGLAQARQAKSPESPITAADLINAMTQMIDEAHAKGIKVIGATLTPYGGANYERPDGEEIHNEVNNFIRHGGKFDGVIDFEKAAQDPAHPDRYLPAYNDKDHLHPNDEGCKAMVGSIDLGLFK